MVSVFTNFFSTSKRASPRGELLEGFLSGKMSWSKGDLSVDRVFSFRILKEGRRDAAPQLPKSKRQRILFQQSLSFKFTLPCVTLIRIWLHLLYHITGEQNHILLDKCFFPVPGTMPREGSWSLNVCWVNQWISGTRGEGRQALESGRSGFLLFTGYA